MMKIFNDLVLVAIGFVLGFYYQEYFEKDQERSLSQPKIEVVKKQDILKEERKLPNKIQTLLKKASAKTNQDQRLTLLFSLINKASYEEALKLFLEIEREDIDLITYNKEDFISELHGWMNTNKGHSELLQFLKKMDEIFYNDVNVLLLLSTAYANKKEWFEAIKASYRARDYITNQIQLNDINKKIRQYASFAFQDLSKEGQYKKIREMYEYILNFDSYDPFYLLDYAFVLAEVGDFEQAIQIASSLVDHEGAGIKAQKLLKKLIYDRNFAQSQANSIKIPIEVEHNHFFVKAVINQTTTVRLLIDTGASYTSIRYSIFSEIVGGGSDNLRSINVHTASDMVTSYVHKVDSLKIAGVTLRGLDIASMSEIGMGKYDGVLGMNFLDYFIFLFDKENKYLILKKKP